MFVVNLLENAVKLINPVIPNILDVVRRWDGLGRTLTVYMEDKLAGILDEIQYRTMLHRSDIIKALIAKSLEELGIETGYDYKQTLEIIKKIMKG